jgi:hypothetical protein
MRLRFTLGFAAVVALGLIACADARGAEVPGVPNPAPLPDWLDDPVRTFERLRAAQEKEPENHDDPPANVKDTKPHDICAAYGAHRVDYISNVHRYWKCQR